MLFEENVGLACYISANSHKVADIVSWETYPSIMRKQILYTVLACALLVGCTQYVEYCDFGTIYPT